MGTNLPWQMVFSILWFFYVLSSERQHGWNSQCLAQCLPEAPAPVLLSGCQGDSEWRQTPELRSLSEESKCFRRLLVKSGQLWIAQYRSRVKSKLSGTLYSQCGLLPGFEDLICIWQSFSIAIFWKCPLSFLLYLSLLTSLFPLWFSGIKKLKVIFLLCLLTVQPSQMVFKLSYRSEKFYYFCTIFFLFLPHDSSKDSVYLQLIISGFSYISLNASNIFEETCWSLFILIGQKIL